jgi:hypothetical protein
LFNFALQEIVTFELFSIEWLHEIVFSPLYEVGDESEIENPVSALAPVISSFAIQVFLAFVAFVCFKLNLKGIAKAISMVVFWSGTLILV